MNFPPRSLLLVGLVMLTGPWRASAELQRVDLGGTWQLNQAGKAETISAKVPGNVHTDLLAAGKIPDPFFRKNEHDLEWIYKTDWTYRRSFDLPVGLLRHDEVLLRCEGLDTVAEVKVNGQSLAHVDNMFRFWEFDVKSVLKDGPNTVEITFSPIAPYIKDFRDRAPKIPNATSIGEMGNIRKSPYMNGWDFGPKFLTCGIYKPIALIAFDKARIQDLAIAQELSDPKKATLQIAAGPDVVGTPDLRISATVSQDGKTVATGEAPCAAGKPLAVTIDNPKLWWPVGLGDHPMYQVAVELKTADGQVLDRTTRRIGLRTMELRLPKGDLPLRLAVNGHEIFAKGTDWIPADVFPARITPAKLRHYIDDAVAVNMNMIRVWGGGLYEDDAFYDACDERGILLWNEFIFACNAYPGANPEFVKNVEAEVRDQVNRLRHHPSIAVWCGNNEVTSLIKGYKLITQEQYDNFFHGVIGKLMQEVYPQACYVGGSPEAGDDHNWWVWHVGANFEKYRESHGWTTEFGFQSFPEPATVDSYTDPADRDSVLSEVNVFHQRNGNKKGNPMILDKVNHYFLAPKDFDSTLWLSQINQAYGMEIGIEHWRADWPKSSGCFVWQYNDCWPGPSWSSVDYFGRWKALQYRFRTAYAPVMVTGDVDAGKGEVQVRVASELAQPAEATLDWVLTDTNGQSLQNGRGTVALPAGTAGVAGPLLTLGDAVKKAGNDNVILWLTVSVGGKKATKMLTMVLPKQLKLTDPGLKTNVVPSGNGFDVTLTAAKPALWAWLTCADPDARYSDNFVHLPGGQSVTIHVTPSRYTTQSALAASFKAQSLYDTYSHSVSSLATSAH